MAANEDFRAARGTAHDPYMDEPEEEELFDDEQPPRKSGRALPIIVASLAILGFVVIVYYAYQQGMRAGSEANPPVIKAEEGPTKVRPAAPGGMEVPNQDMKVYELGKPGTQQAAPGVERILPKPEEPLQRPPVPVPAPPPQVTAAPALPGVTAAPTMPVATAPASALPGASGPAAAGVATGAAPAVPGVSGTLPPMSMITGNPLPTTGVATPPPPPLPSANQTTAPPLGTGDAQAAARAAGVPAPPPLAAPPRDNHAATPAPASRGGLSLGGAAPPIPVTPPTPRPAPAQQAVAQTPAAAPAAPVPPISTAPAAAPSAGGIGVQLMAGKSQEEAEGAWRRIRGAHQELLGSASHEVQFYQDQRGTFYRLRVLSGSKAEADALCTALKARKQDCLVR